MFENMGKKKTMKKHILKIGEKDKINFDLIRNGEKKIETRANTEKYQKIEKGDFLIFTCGNEKIEKK
jgi:ASC-1-like (ASCH) protein